MAEITIQEIESNAAAITRKEITEPIKAATDVLDLATQIQTSALAEKRTNAKIVRLLLLQRIQNDLRCCVILVERGYSLQAIALAAGIFEAWVTLANIKTEDEAQKWLSHTKDNESFGRIRLLTERALQNVVDGANNAKKMYRQYQQLCMPKHLNPVIEKSRGYTVLEGGRIQFCPGPDTSELAIAWGWFALERGSRFANLALFTIAHSQQTPPALHRELIARQAALDVLQAECAKRWPDNYPEK